LGFQEFYDSEKNDNKWLSVSYDNSKWLKPHCMALGAMPWHDLEERSIPLLKEKIFTPKTITSYSEHKSTNDVTCIGNIVDLYLKEKRKWKKPNLQLKSKGKWFQFEVSKLNKNNSIAYCLDFGKEVVGSISLEIDGGKGGEIIDSLICEAVDGTVPVILPTNLSSHISFGNRLILKNGKTIHEQFEQWGFRYLVLVIRNYSGKLKVKTKLRSMLYPMKVKGAFNSSRQVLNNIYNISVLTQQNCMLDAYVDCPWREQVQWWGDARVQAKNTFILSADSKLFARGIKQIGTQNVPNGLTYGHAPTSAHHCILPDFTLTWILTHWDYYWQTGDISLFVQMKDKIHQALEYFYSQTNRKSLLVSDERYWLFLDWVDVYRDGNPTLYNLFYIMALKAVVELFKLVDDSESTSIYSKRLKKTVMSVKKYLFDKKNKIIFAGLTKEGKPVKKHLSHIYTIAMILDIFPEYNNEYSKIGLLPVLKAKTPTKNYPSPFFINYIFEAAKKMGLYSEVLSCIETHWGNMLDRGLTTTEEVWNAEAGLWSLCHAWSAHPIVHFSEILLGINQTVPGWKQIVFKPFFADIDFVKGKVATPLGTIESSWKKFDKGVKVQLTVPDKMKCLVDISGIKTHSIKSGRHEWIVKNRVY
jgi:hypothetical protein